MTFFGIIDALLFKPLVLLFEVIYVFANKIIGNPGLSIIVLSLVMNFLVLPLYRRADAMQEEERDTEARLHKGVSHIKKTFRGDEKMMILQTFYRQNDYKPTYVLKGATSLFLEIPFFISAYRFLSGLELIKGVSFGPIADLGVPDGLLPLFGWHINILPIIMTAVNLVSCVIFTKGAAPKTKIQLYSMAIFFLFFLYTSPAGLVFYWTLNNVFSLVKTIFYKLKNPGKVLGILFSLVGLAILVYGIFIYSTESIYRKAFVILIGLASQFPLILILIISKKKVTHERTVTPNPKRFFASGTLLSIFTGLFIPLSVIKSSAQEFVNIRHYQSPIWFGVNSFCLAVGVFVIWMGIFYWLSSPKSKVLFEKCMWTLCGVTVLNFMFFGKNLGLMSSTLSFENGMSFSKAEKLINIAAVVATIVVFLLLFRFFGKHIFKVLTVVIVALAVMVPLDVVNINEQLVSVRQSAESDFEMPSYTISKNGKNVVVIMLDRAMGELMPVIFNEKPELKEQFAGFTVYNNVLSAGSFTNFGTPSMMGGYEYTCEKMNARDTEKLVDKHNETVKLMPQLFDENGFDVTVFDPVYANYQWNPDLTIFDEYPNVKSYVTKGAFESEDVFNNWKSSNMRNFFAYSITKSVPLIVQPYLYDGGKYSRSDIQEINDSGYQYIVNPHEAYGYSDLFNQCYSVLENLSNITHVSDDTDNSFLFMTNDITHNPALLQEPDYTPEMQVNNTEYDEAHKDRFTVDGKTLSFTEAHQYTHYDVNMAAMIKMGEWMDYLRENGVYDNTRIILVSDHGRNGAHSEDYILPDGTDAEFFFPLLMVKDFGSQEFCFSDEFMTNADVPTLAMDGVIANPVNPFTGNPINNDAKKDPFYVFYSDRWDVEENNGNQFLPGDWYRIDNQKAYDVKNWTKVGEDTVLPEGYK